MNHIHLKTPIVTGRELLELATLEEAVKWFWKLYPKVNFLLAVPPELKFKARELVHKIREENPLTTCQIAVIYEFCSPSAWLLISKEILETDGN